MTYMFILMCALKLVLKNILYYDARSEKHQTAVVCFRRCASSIFVLEIPVQNGFQQSSFNVHVGEEV